MTDTPSAVAYMREIEIEDRALPIGFGRPLAKQEQEIRVRLILNRDIEIFAVNQPRRVT